MNELKMTMESEFVTTEKWETPEMSVISTVKTEANILVNPDGGAGLS